MGERVANDAWLSSGQMLDHFQLVRELGRGAMGVVFEAEDTLLRRRAAIKLIPAERSSSAFDLIREARAAGRLDHPHVLRVLHVGRWPGGHYLVLELVAGGSLHDQLAKGPLSWRDATAAAADACRGLAAAHAAGIVHRDIKPANLMRGPNGVKVADFGLARGGDLTATSASMLAGTPYYMSPEQCRGEVADARSDIYALGATYVHLLTGRPPYEAPTPAQVMFAHCAKPPPELNPAEFSLPPACAAIARRAMAKAPADRYPDAHAMLADLEAALAADWRPAPPAVAAGDATVRAVSASGQTAGKRPARRALPRPAALAVGASTLLLALIVIWAAWAAPWRLWFPQDEGVPGAARAAGSATTRAHEVVAPAAFDPEIPREGRLLSLTGEVRAVAFSPDGELFAAGDGAGVTIWSLATGEVVRRLDWGAIRCLAFYHGPKVALLAGGERGPWLWFRETDFSGPYIPGWQEDWGPVDAVAATSAGVRAHALGGRIIVHSQGGDTIWDADAAESVPVTQLVFAPPIDRRLLAAAYADGAWRLFNSDTGAEAHRAPPDPSRRRVVLAFAPFGDALAAAFGDTVRFWNVNKRAPAPETLRVAFEPPRGEGPVILALAYSPDGALLATGDSAGGVLVWNASTRKPASACPGEHGFPGEHGPALAVAFHPRGRLLAAGHARGAARLWNVGQQAARRSERIPENQP